MIMETQASFQIGQSQEPGVIVAHLIATLYLEKKIPR